MSSYLHLAVVLAALIVGPTTAPAAAMSNVKVVNATSGLRVSFAMAYGDGMVLQHGGTGAHVWGYAAPESPVKVTLSRQEGSETVTVVSIAAADNGMWQATLPPQIPSTNMSYTLTASDSNGDSASLQDIVFGDVWVCSGQSNMDHPMTSIINATQEITAANLVGSAVRILKVRHNASVDPTIELDDLPSLETRWSYSNNVTVSNFSATCWLTGSILQQHLGYPVGLIDSSWAGVGIQTLSSRVSCANCGVDAMKAGCVSSPYFPANATSVYNNMIHPLHRTTIAGVFWWQGENNAPGCPQQVLNYNVATYYCMWQSMISDWRARWHESSNFTTQAMFPFGFVQLEPTASPGTRWDEVAHRITTPNECLPNVFMAAALDYGDTVAGVHTRYKRPIAARLVLSARAIAYNESIYHSGPVAKSGTISADNKTVTLEFDNVGPDGVALKSGLNGFSVCGNKNAAQCYKYSNDIDFFNVTASKGEKNNEIILHIPAGVADVGGVGIVRYEWQALPCNWPELESCAVYSEGLPAPPFMLWIGPNNPGNPACTSTSLLDPKEKAETTEEKAKMNFVHPGVFLGQHQLDYVRKQAKINGSIVNQTLEKIVKFTYVNARNKSSMSPDWNGTISCGYFDSHDYGCRNESSDATTALTQAYLWAVTGDPIWATRAISIMNYYAKHLKEYALWGNGILEAGWASDKWARAAEIISSTGAPWEKSDVDAFKNMLIRASIPAIYNGSCFNGNWELAMIEGMSAIAVFTENATLWDHTIAMWRARLPAYFYMSSDGSKPVGVPHCEHIPYWYGQNVFNESVDGVCQETCRDFGHTSYGLAATFNTAETALIQGLDLYTPNADRLTAAMEFHTTLLNRGGYPPSGSAYKPAQHNVTDPLVCNNTDLKLSYASTYQVGLTSMARLGRTAQLPQTIQYVQDWVWKLDAGDSCPPFMYCYEALTHSGFGEKSARTYAN